MAFALPPPLRRPPPSTRAPRPAPQPRALQAPPPRASPSPRKPPPRKPRGYWTNERNLSAELARFRTAHGLPHGVMPTAAQLLAAGRADLVRALQRSGGFAAAARRLGLVASRRERDRLAFARGKRRRWERVFGDVNDAALLQGAGKGMEADGERGGDMDGERRGDADGERHEDADKTVQIADVETVVQVEAETDDSREDRTDEPSRRPKRRPRQYWNSWRNVEKELHMFASAHCNGHMPLQRQLLAEHRTDLMNGVRMHGGSAHVARRAGLTPSPSAATRRPHGYWDDATVLRAELLTFTARNGYPGLMPRRDQLRRAGRSDLCYAIVRHGGFSTVAAMLHLVWHGPSSFWRIFRNVKKRLMAFVRKRDLGSVMPSVQTLQAAGRLDLVYGVALHGGVMEVAKRIGLKVIFPKHEDEYWQLPANVQRELKDVLLTQPLERRQFMLPSVALVQVGRADLANAIRDHGGWVYYAQRLGLRFAFEVRSQGFWQRESNVCFELLNYVDRRYGTWEHPGMPLSARDRQHDKVNRLHARYIPSLDMLKRDGRSDIAFAIVRYHGSIERFATRNNLVIAEDVVHVKPAEVLMEWGNFAAEIDEWIQQHGANGIMPAKQDLIRTGRHDLRYAMYKHGGYLKVSQRLQLVFAEDNLEYWLPQWLGMQAGKLGLAIQLAEKEKLLPKSAELLRSLESQLSGRVLGMYRLMATSTAADVVSTSRIGSRRSLRHGFRQSAKLRGAEKLEESTRKISAEELVLLRAKYKHLPPDDIITV